MSSYDGLTPEVIDTAQQLVYLTSTGHELCSRADPTTIELANAIDELYPRPQTTEEPGRTTRSTRTTPQDTIAPWAIDRSDFNTQLRRFRASVTAFEQSTAFQEWKKQRQANTRSPSITPFTDLRERSTSVEHEYSRPTTPTPRRMAADTPFNVETLQAMIAKAVADALPTAITEALRTRTPRSKSPTPDTPPSQTSIKTTEIGFFYPDMPLTWGSTPMVEKDGKTYYRDVNAFTNRLKVLTITKTSATIRSSVDACLKGEAAHWWNNELSDTLRVGIVQLQDGIKGWEEALLKRFKTPPSQALSTLMNLRYTIYDARDKKSPTAFMSQVIAAAKTCGLGNTEYSQVLHTWNSLDIQLRKTIDEPKEQITVAEFMDILVRKQLNWFDEYARQPRNISVPYNPSYGRQKAPYRGGYQSRSYSTYQYGDQPAVYQPTPYQPAAYQGYYQPQRQSPVSQNEAYNNQQSRGYDQNARERGLISMPQRKQITAEPANQQPQQRQQSQSNVPNSGKAPQHSQQFRPQYFQQYPTPRPQGAYVEDAIGENAEEPYEDSPELYDDNGDRMDDNQEEYVENLFATSSEHSCSQCKDVFPSRNKLFAHLRATHFKDKTKAKNDAKTDTPTPTQTSSMPPKIGQAKIIRSTATRNTDIAHAFRNCHYAVLRIALTPDGALHEVCPDTGCTMSVIDRNFLAKAYPQAKITKLPFPVPVQGIGNQVHQCDEFVKLNIHVPGVLPDGTNAIGVLNRGARIVDNLRANMLIGMDILGPEEATIDLAKKVLQLGACNDLQAPVRITPKGMRIQKQIIRAKTTTTIPPHSSMMIPIIRKALPNRDFLFEPIKLPLGIEGGVMAHILDTDTAYVEARNTTDRPVQLPARRRLGYVQEFEAQGCYTAQTDMESLAAGPISFRKVAALTLSALALTASYALPEHTEKTISSGITIYGTPETQATLSTVANTYPDIWKPGGIADIPQEDWLTIPLRPNAKIESAKVYPLGVEAQKVVDDTFDQLHEEGKMEWSRKPTSHGYPVFVVWKLVNGQKKGRVVVDIRGLNAIAEPDTYLMPLQTDITSAVQGCLFISTVDFASFFYQWPVAPENRHKFTVVSHRG